MIRKIIDWLLSGLFSNQKENEITNRWGVTTEEDFTDWDLIDHHNPDDPFFIELGVGD